MGSGLEVEKRVELLLAEMTLEEKVGQMNQVRNVSDKDRDAICGGWVGSSLFASGAFAGNVRDAGTYAPNLNGVQKMAVEQSRLGIPILFARDVIHGHRTVFPIPLGQAASWSPDLIEKAAEVAAREATADGLRWTFTPMLDIARDPRWGRIAEGFGEDPFLCSRLAEAAVRGYQGDHLSDPGRMAACAKHYVAYGGAEGGRDYNTVNLGERCLRDVYLPSFHAAVKAGLATVMASFNEIDGVPSTANRRLLTEVLRGEWGFDGFVVTDWNAVRELMAHGVAADEAEAVRKAVRAGADMDMVSGLYVKHLATLVRQGEVDEATVNESVRRILRIKFRLGLFERPYVDPVPADSVMLRPESRRIARDLAARSLVLLKNDGILPLSPSVSTLLLTGPLATARGELFGTWTLDGLPEDVTPVSEAIAARMVHPEGLRVKSFVDEAVLHSRYADVAVVCVGEHPARSGEANSASSIDLPPGQLEFCQALHRYGVPIVAVVFAGRPLAIEWLSEHAAAVVYAWHPGIEGGSAIADVLFGVRSPEGRLPVTLPRSTGQVPVYYNYKPTGRPLPVGVRRHARYCDGSDDPLHGFGFGLTYTRFEYSNLVVHTGDVRADGRLSVSVELANVGPVAGVETVQLYVRDLAASVTRPVRELKAFAKVALEPGARTSVKLAVAVADLAFTREDGSWGVEPGEHEIWVGGSSQGGLQATFRIR
jgi:beta-glucosidase